MSSGPRNFRKVTHCIFDMDGLLLDTEVVYEKIVRQIAGVYGKNYPMDVRFKILGTSTQRSAEIAVRDLNLPITVDDYLQRYKSLCGQMLGNTPLLKGAQRLLMHLHEHKVPIALATSSGQDMVEIKTTHHRDLFKLFHHRVCGSTDAEVKNGKPAPDIFLVAARRFPVPANPENCLVFEDAPNGVQAAVSAGMQVVMVPDPRCPQEQTQKATQVLSSLEEFAPQQFGLPPFKS